MAEHGGRLSVLDIAPIWKGAPHAQALRESVELAPKIESLGYRRYWVAEHHNTLNIASSAPAVLIGALADVTSTMRIGSGGVLLPNHAPLAVAEQFGTLEALHPGRIDLGLGRAPGTDPHTAQALRRSAGAADDFPAILAELSDYFDPATAGDPTPPVIAVPAPGNAPDIWMLGSSPSSAAFAARLGLPYAFAHHIAPGAAEAAIRLYRRDFRPSRALEHPYALVAASVVVADTEEEARRLRTPLDVATLQLRRPGRTEPFLPPDEADLVELDAVDRDVIAPAADRHIVGTPDQIGEHVGRLLADTAADELMALTIVHDPAARLRSYELLAEAVPPPAGGVPQDRL